MNRLSDATLNGMTKKQLIEYVRMCEHNYDIAEETLRQQAENVKDWRPVKHGEWIPAEMNAENKENAEMLGIDIEAFLSKAAYCSYCGRQQITNGRDKTRNALIHKAIYIYCPNYGAKMDGDADETP